MVSLQKTMAINCWDVRNSIVKVDLREMHFREARGRLFIDLWRIFCQQILHEDEESSISHQL